MNKIAPAFASLIPFACIGIFVLVAGDQAIESADHLSDRSSKVFADDLNRFLGYSESKRMTEQESLEMFEWRFGLSLPESAIFLGGVSSTPGGDWFFELRYQLEAEPGTDVIKQILKAWRETHTHKLWVLTGRREFGAGDIHSSTNWAKYFGTDDETIVEYDTDTKILKVSESDGPLW